MVVRTEAVKDIVRSITDRRDGAEDLWRKRIILIHQKLRIRITKEEWDMIRNRLNLSFHVGAPNKGLRQDMII
ncbi:hypothetical protein MTR_7g028930 [Medicago truncatula]|uniref:Uncharacterized protein n=1 Tax=Medicago truncatula TaxID=3880 RepID=A0A072TWX4_MEDTR|nr:hypothetical protein MTR_7g028930 [Medicago truncatula]